MVRGIAFSSQLLRMGNEGGEGSRKGPLVWFSVAAPPRKVQSSRALGLLGGWARERSREHM